MKAVWNSQQIAESNDTIIIEGNHYFPPNSVSKGFLESSDYHTTCFWKGDASYYDIVVNGETNQNSAWYYPVPKDGSVERVGKDFANYIAFWHGVEITE